VAANAGRTEAVTEHFDLGTETMARANTTIATLGTNVSASALTGPKVLQALQDGVEDLRGCGN